MNTISLAVGIIAYMLMAFPVLGQTSTVIGPNQTTIGPNGTITRTLPNGNWAKITAPPGTKLSACMYIGRDSG
jgi:hypothetical protein